MLKAAALVYALVMALIIGTLSGSIVLYSYMNSVTLESWRQKEKLIDNVNSGLNLLLSNQTVIGPDEQKTIDLFNSGTDPVQLARKSWGIFEVLTATACWKNNSVKKTALAGFPAGPDSSTCFYLCEADRPLSVCGKTLLTGTCFLPKEGIRTAYIEGKNFIGDQPVHGFIKNSTGALPEFNKDAFGYIDGILGGKTSVTDSLIRADANELPDTLINSFSAKTLLVYSPGPFVVSGKTIEGNVCIRSGSKVILREDARLRQVIVCAPEIVVEEHFTGQVQLFASDSIVIKKQARLVYPSAAGIIRTARSKDNISMVIENEVRIDGDVFCLETSHDNKKQCALYIHTGDTITGQVFSNGNLSLQGTVYGSVVCSHILLKTSSAIYENHLLDAVVNRPRLPPYYCGMNLWSREERKRIAAWLN